MIGKSLDDPSRINEIKDIISEKPSLVKFYTDIYYRAKKCFDAIPINGKVLELGSGASFAKKIIPEILTSDVIEYAGVDLVVDATKMPFEENELKAIFLMNVFHHIPNVENFLFEAHRCLAPGGKIFIFDQNFGFFSQFIYRYIHHEPFDPKRESWDFPSQGPLSDANGALAWIVFARDKAQFEHMFKGKLELMSFRRHTPLIYWLCGGLKRWSLLPGCLYRVTTWVDYFIGKVIPGSPSFVDIILKK